MRNEAPDAAEKTLSLPALGRAVLFLNLALVPVVFSRRTVDAFAFNKTALLQLASLVLLVGGLVHWLRQPRRFPALTYIKDPLCLGFVLFWVSALVSTVLSVNPLLSLRGASSSHLGLLTVTAYVVLFFATRALVQNIDDMRRHLLACVLAAAVVTTYALVQRLGADGLTWSNVSQIGDYARPFSTLGHANLLAAYLTMVLPVLLWWGWQARERGRTIVAALLGLMAVAAILFSLSRAAWLALAAAALLGLLGWQKKTRVVALSVSALSLLGLGAWVLFAPCRETAVPLRERAAQMQELGPRRHLWATSWRLAQDRPVAGWGLDTFALVFPRQRSADYWRVEWNTLPDRAHNIGLHLLATQGLLGAAAGLVLLAGLIMTGMRGWRRGDARTRPLILVCGAGLVAFLVQAVFGFTTPSLGVVAVTFAALLSRLSRRGVVAERPRCCPRPVWLVAAVAILVVLGDALGTALIESERSTPLLGAVALLALPGMVLVLLWRGEAGAVVCTVEEDAVPATGWRGAIPLVLWAGVVGLVAWWFVPQYRADVACANGQRQFDAAPIAALNDLDQATQLDPDNEAYWTALGHGAHQAAQRSVIPAHRERLLLQALAAYDRAAQLVPDRAETAAARGRILAGLNRRNEAAQSFERALALDPSNPYLYLDAARTAAEAGRPDAARSLRQQGANLYPDFAPLAQGR